LKPPENSRLNLNKREVGLGALVNAPPLPQFESPTNAQSRSSTQEQRFERIAAASALTEDVDTIN
jgi:hypothetical protein